jgi:hypothetical protein
MTTIFERVEDALSAISPAVPYALAPYLSADGTLPDLYLAYSLIIGTGEQWADDVETGRRYDIQISIYSRDGLVALPNVDAAMTAAGFQIGSERPLPKDRSTGHFGLAKEYVFLEAKE